MIDVSLIIFRENEKKGSKKTFSTRIQRELY
mgnify:CR=1 FL=1